MEGNTRSEPPLRERDPLTRTLRARPLLLAAALFLLGCALQYMLDLPYIASGIALLALLLLPLCLLHRRRLAVALLALAMLPAGMLRFDAAWRAVEPLDERTGVQLTGRICEMPEFNADTQRTVCVLDEFRLDGVPRNGRIQLYLRGDEALLQGVRLGQRVDVLAHIWRSDEATNPGQFNYSNYRRSRGLRNYATAEIETAEFADTPERLTDLPEKLRCALNERIDRLFPNHSALARALVLGDRGGLSAEERVSYARAGAAHLLAISGMHLSVLAGLIALLLGRFLKRNAAFGVTLTLLTAYGLLIGYTPSLARAAIMYAIFGLAPLAGRRSDGPTRLGAALLLHLLIRPTAILDAGFALSYGATAGIILLAPPLGRLPLLRRILDERVDFRRPLSRALRWIAGAAVATLAAQLAILPAVVHFFGAQPVWSLLTNLLAAPLTMIAYVPALLGALFNLAPVAAVADFLFGLLTALVTGIAALPFAQVRVARFPLWLVAICVLLCLASSDLSRLPKRLRRWLPFTVLLAIPIANLCAWLPTLGLSVVFLDAGQADCAVIRSEGCVYLVDAGDDYGPAADYLSAMNYAPEAIFLTHSHLDHAGGLADVLAVCVPKRIYLSANWDNFYIDPELTAALDAARAAGAEVTAVSAGDEIALSERAILRVLSPKAGISTDSANDDSLILRLEYGSARALFLADAPAEVSTGLAGDVDLMKVAHHGARDGTTAALLAETTPSAAVISVGRGNSYGHPVPRVLEMLNAAGARVYRTDRSGAVTCRVREDGTLTLRGYLPFGGRNELE